MASLPETPLSRRIDAWVLRIGDALSWVWGLLLLVALGLIGIGGAFFLVRSVGRETELANMKVDLLSRVSHELKTPLSMIKMYGDTVSLGRTRNQAETERFASVLECMVGGNSIAG